MIKIQSFKDDEDIDGFGVMKLPEGTLVDLKTEDKEPKTGEVAYYSLGKEFGSPRFKIYSRLPEIYKNMKLLKSEIKSLKQENNEIKQRLDDLYPIQEIIEIKELPDKKIVKLILKYLKEHKNQVVYPSDIAFENNLDAKKVFEICEKLKNEEEIR